MGNLSIRACNYVQFKTGRNLPPVLKIVTRTVHIELNHFVNVTKHTRASVVQFNNFALTAGFYWSYTLLLKSLVLVHSCLGTLPRM